MESAGVECDGVCRRQVRWGSASVEDDGVRRTIAARTTAALEYDGGRRCRVRQSLADHSGTDYGGVGYDGVRRRRDNGVCRTTPARTTKVARKNCKMTSKFTTISRHIV